MTDARLDFEAASIGAAFVNEKRGVLSLMRDLHRGCSCGFAHGCIGCSDHGYCHDMSCQEFAPGCKLKWCQWGGHDDARSLTLIALSSLDELYRAKMRHAEAK